MGFFDRIHAEREMLRVLERIAAALERLAPPILPDDAADDEAAIDNTPYIPQPVFVEEEIKPGERARVVNESIIDSVVEGW